MRVEMQDNLQHLQLWANKERNLIKILPATGAIVPAADIGTY